MRHRLDSLFAAACFDSPPGPHIIFLRFKRCVPGTIRLPEEALYIGSWVLKMVNRREAEIVRREAVTPVFKSTA